MRISAQPGRAPIVVVSFRGKPAPGAVVKAFPDEGEPVELKADAQGRLEYRPAAEGRAGLLAKWTEKASGERERQGVRRGPLLCHLDRRAGRGDRGRRAGPAAAAPFAALPQAVDSFGGAVLGDWLYVYGGHTGKMHKYSRETASKHFRRLNLRDRTTWEELPCGPPLQGVTLMSHGGHLYRIGGMAPHNPPGEPSDLVSVADFARFDPESKTWTDLRPCPTPRSTHDSVVVGDRIYVIGGWSMNGGDSANSEFLDTALVFDLARAGAGWEKLPTPPFRRRALAVGAVDGKVYAIGGLTEDGKVVKSVDIYDIALGRGRTDPSCPAASARASRRRRLKREASCTSTGSTARCSGSATAGDRWEVAGKLVTPRLTHRLLPGIANDLLAVGGSVAGAPISIIESFPLAAVPVRP